MTYPIEKYLTVICLLILIPLTLAAAFVRHLHPDYYPPLVAASATLLAWLTAFAIPLAVSTGAYERFNLLGNRLGPRSRLALARFVDQLVALFAAAILLASLGPLVQDLFLSTGIGKYFQLFFGKNRQVDLYVLAAVPPAAVLTLIRLRQRRNLRNSRWG